MRARGLSRTVGLVAVLAALAGGFGASAVSAQHDVAGSAVAISKPIVDVAQEDFEWN